MRKCTECCRDVGSNWENLVAVFHRMLYVSICQLIDVLLSYSG